jgi:hypothetical protein
MTRGQAIVFSMFFFRDVIPSNRMRTILELPSLDLRPRGQLNPAVKTSSPFSYLRSIEVPLGNPIKKYNRTVNASE